MSEETTIDTSTQASLDQAFKEQVRVVIPQPFELQVDIDNDADYLQFKQAYALMLRDTNYVPSSYKVEPSRNGGEGKHITVTLYAAITPIERVALQAILGSDWRRELFSLQRIAKGEPLPTLFYEKQ